MRDREKMNKSKKREGETGRMNKSTRDRLTENK